MQLTQVYTKRLSLMCNLRGLLHVTSTIHQENISVTCIPPPHRTQHLCSKTGVCRGIPIFLFLLQNIDCGYSLEPPRRGGSYVYTQSMFEKYHFFSSRNFHFYNRKNDCILYWRVFVMYTDETTLKSVHKLHVRLCFFF